MDKENHNCDNINCNHNDTKGLCCLFNPDNCKYRQLQKENEVLKGRIEGFEKQILGLLYKYESVYKRFPDLKDAMNKAESILKENAELKEVIDNDVDKKIYVQLAKKAKSADVYKDQLTKAKDFMLKLTTYLEGHTNYDFEYELIKEVKQFLKESEVEK